jgi:hypothetical protein
MSVMIQIRNVPDPVHGELKARAALARMSLSEYILKELEKSLERPTPRQLLERLRTRQPVEPRESVVDALRAERESR